MALRRRSQRAPSEPERSDESVRDDASRRLAEADAIDASKVRLEIRDGVMKLEGSVPKHWMRGAIADAVNEVPGVLDVENRLEVATDVDNR